MINTEVWAVSCVSDVTALLEHQLIAGVVVWFVDSLVDVLLCFCLFLLPPEGKPTAGFSVLYFSLVFLQNSKSLDAVQKSRTILSVNS